MRRGTARLLWGGIVIAALVVAVALAFRPKPIPVTVHRIDRGRVEETVVNSRAGTVESRFRAGMSPAIAGLIREIPVAKGSHVRRGDLLLRLDDAEFRHQVVLAERSMQAARAAAEQACLAADQAERDRQRAEALASEKVLADQALEEARTRSETMAAACRAAREQARQAEAAVQVARATLEKTVMLAPFDGVVLDIAGEIGEWISPSPPGVYIPPVIDLVAPDSLYVSAPLDEVDVARVRVGQPARLTFDAFRGREFRGRLTYISSYVETRQEQNRTLTVEAVFEEESLPPNLLPGLSADIEVILEAREDALRVPSYALLEGDRVLVVKGGKLAETKVKTGLRNWEYAEVLEGVAAGDQVVISLDRPEVKEGARVTVSEEASQ